MGPDASTEARLSELLQKDPAYPREAYLFLLAGLDRAQQMHVPEGAETSRRHMRGPELLEALRDLALDEFGPLACRVLASWGVRRTEDFGQLVFKLVGAGLLSATPDDSPTDFADGYDFATAFVEPFAEEGEPPTDLPPIT